MKRLIYLSAFIVLLISCEQEDGFQINNEEVNELRRNESSQDTIYIPAQDGKRITLTKYDDTFYLYGDILLNKEQIELLRDEASGRTVAVTGLSKRWPNLNIYYRFNPSFSSTTNVQTAITRINNKFDCINFIQLASNQTADSYIEFKDINDPNIGGLSSLGRQGGKQDILINPNGSSVGTVIHELGHALGLFHEQVRSDRNNSIIVNYQNIQPQFHSQYNIPSNQITVGNFDFGSVMLYSSFNSFGTGSGPTMTRLNGIPFTGQRDNFSIRDIQTIASIHDFSYTTDQRINDISISHVLIDYEYSADTQYEEREFYVNFPTPLTSSITFEWYVRETVSNIQGHPSGQQTTYTYYSKTLASGQSSYLLTTLVTKDENYDYGEPDGPQYNRWAGIADYCFGPSSSIRK